jgi:hypothetical protein
MAKKVVWLFNAAFTVALNHLISCVHLSSFVVMLHKQLKYSKFCSCFGSIKICTGAAYLEIITASWGYLSVFVVLQRVHLGVPYITFIVLLFSCVSDVQDPILHYKHSRDAVQENLYSISSYFASLCHMRFPFTLLHNIPLVLCSLHEHIYTRAHTKKLSHVGNEWKEVL